MMSWQGGCLRHGSCPVGVSPFDTTITLRNLGVFTVGFIHAILSRQRTGDASSVRALPSDPPKGVSAYSVILL
jgi:hypothetical protein